MQLDEAALIYSRHPWQLRGLHGLEGGLARCRFSDHRGGGRRSWNLRMKIGPELPVNGDMGASHVRPHMQFAFAGMSTCPRVKIHARGVMSRIDMLVMLITSATVGQS